MADYRSFCHSCGNEIAFGSHKEGCEVQAAIRKAYAERIKFIDDVHESVDMLPLDKILEELILGKTKIAGLQSAINAEFTRFDVLRTSYLERGGNIDDFKREGLW